MTEGKIGTRLKVLAALCAFMFAALGTRLWFVQVLASEQYRREARHNGIKIVFTPAPRGRILDRNGNVLVGNRSSLVVTINRQELGDHAAEVLPRLSRLLEVPVKDLRTNMDDPRYYAYAPVPVAFDVPKEVAFWLGEHEDRFPGVSYEELPVRTYPLGTLAAHVLGATGQITADLLKDPRFEGYLQNDVVGRAGLEATYEHALRGVKGEQKIQVDASGKNLGTIGTPEPPTPGHDLLLSLDERIQKLTESSLALGEKKAREVVDAESGKHFEAPAGAAVVIEPRTGRIVAIASSPTFDPRVFVDGLSQVEYDRFNAPLLHQPLLNRATQAAYPPGSTFKPFVALSALRRGIATEGGSWDCPAVYHVPGTTNPPEYKHNWASYNLGYLSLPRALVQSCDTIFYQWGYDYWRRYRDSGSGVGDLANYKGRTLALQPDLERFGFGRPSGVDIPSEYSGRIPTPAWKAGVHREHPKLFPDGRWFPGDYLNMSIGQGDVLITPLQLAVAYSAIANGGKVLAPRLGLRIQSPGGAVERRIKADVVGHLPFTKQQLAFIRGALEGVTADSAGTAYYAFRGFPLYRIPVAGKTGTAEVPPFQPFSWFAAMAPAPHPKYVVVCYVEQAGHGSQTAAPVVRRILEGLYHLPQTPLVVAGPRD